jgi:hypothetical protein
MNAPDVKKINTNQVHTTRGQAVPRHWNNSPYMNGRYGFGANPEEVEDESKILSYTEWVSRNNRSTIATDSDDGELAKGIKVEMEHTTDANIAKKIALDHLKEIPDYYTRLIAMEKEAGIE